jgi:hypothetical protein
MSGQYPGVPSGAVMGTAIDWTALRSEVPVHQPSLFTAPAPDDVAWLAQVRTDAGCWWASTDRDRTEGTCPLWLGNADAGYWLVFRRGDLRAVGGRWPDRAAARLWLWLALGIVSWQLVPDVATARRQHFGAELDAAEERFRRALAGQ